MSRFDFDAIRVDMGDDGRTVVIRRNASSAPLIATALDVCRDWEGRPVRIVLDRLIHDGTESRRWGNWVVSGAFVSVLEKIGSESEVRN